MFEHSTFLILGPHNFVFYTCDLYLTSFKKENSVTSYQIDRRKGGNAFFFQLEQTVNTCSKEANVYTDKLNTVQLVDVLASCRPEKKTLFSVYSFVIFLVLFVLFYFV